MEGELILFSGLGVLEETYYRLISLVTQALTGKTGVHAVKWDWKRNEDTSRNVKTKLKFFWSWHCATHCHFVMLHV
ncbi:MAG: hypothetical protein AYK19_22025 [Theionarchaea archaeon DG-70-1]|nr:MAG: hypothetical protein AYK19_22025 [Theionarchaea archaeon DG-70-1]